MVKVHAAAGHLTTSEEIASDAKALDSGKHKRRQVRLSHKQCRNHKLCCRLNRKQAGLLREQSGGQKL